MHDEWLRFFDETAAIRTEYERSYVFTLAQGLRIEGGDLWYLDCGAISDDMRARGRERWAVRFAEIEPEFDRFVEHYCRHPLERHAVTGGYGRWLNGLGHWDYWELGGGFDGRITGRPSRKGSKRASVTSGPSRIRDAIDGLAGALATTLNRQLPHQIDVATDDNVELVSRLREELLRGDPSARPGVIVLPDDGRDDSLRWLHEWPETGPFDSLAALDLPATAAWLEVLAHVYEQFDDHWAAAVSFHF